MSFLGRGHEWLSRANTMIDRRTEIPSFAFINAQIIQKAIHTTDFGQCVRSVEEQYGLSPGELGDGFFYASHVVSLLYCLIVVPREVWDDLPENHKVYDMIDATWLLTLFEVELSEGRLTMRRQEHPAYYLIYHLRNAVAHARFSIAEDGRFTFWDQPNKTSAPNFRASLSRDSLQEFLSKVGALLANLRTGEGSGWR